MRVAVLGSTGFVGRHLVRRLAAQNFRVSLYNRRPWGPLPPGVTEQIGALEDAAPMKSFLESGDVLVYLAWSGYPLVELQAQDARARGNVGMAASIMEMAAREGVRRLVFVSSGGTVYGEPLYLPIDERHPTHPISPYGQEKLAVEDLVRRIGETGSLECVVLRPSTVFGPGQRPGRGQGLITTAMGRLRQGEPVDVWGSGEEIRDYLFVDDLVEALVLAGATPLVPPVVNLGTGAGLPVSEVLRRIANVTGIEPHIRQHAAPANAVHSNVLDCALARASLGWAPETAFEEGLAKTWAWIRSGDPDA